MRFALAALTLAFLVTTGCRDAVVDPLPEGSTSSPPPASQDGRSEVYVKGPNIMVIGQESEFRTEPNAETVRFGWYFEGDAVLEIASSSTRATLMTARDYGATTLVAVHYDENGRIVGIGRKPVTVVVD